MAGKYQAGNNAKLISIALIRIMIYNAKVAFKMEG